jgi:hypothetical protein
MAQSENKDRKNRTEPPPRPVVTAPAQVVDKWGLREAAVDAFSVDVPSDLKGGKNEIGPSGAPYRTYTAAGQQSDYFIITAVGSGDKRTVFLVSKGTESIAATIKKTGGKIISQKVISYLGCPAREVTLQSPENIPVVLRVIGALNRGYALVYLSSKPGTIDSTRSLRFLDSFKFDTTGCKESNVEAGADPDPGKTANGIYTNNYFGLKLQLPAGWPVQDNYVRGSIMEIGRQAAKSKNEEINAVVEATAETTRNLLTVFKHSLGASQDFNASFVVGIERIKDMVLDGQTYAVNNKKLLTTLRPDMKFPRDIYSERLDGVEFAVMEARSEKAGFQIKQKYYTTIMKGYALFFVILYNADEDFPRLDQIIRSVKFAK